MLRARFLSRLPEKRRPEEMVLLLRDTRRRHAVRSVDPRKKVRSPTFGLSIQEVSEVFTKLSDLQKAAVFSVLVLVLAVTAALSIKALGLTSLLAGVVWSSTPA